MAKNYESENKAKNYTTDKTSNSRNTMDSQNCGKNSSKNKTSSAYDAYDKTQDDYSDRY